MKIIDNGSKDRNKYYLRKGGTHPQSPKNPRPYSHNTTLKKQAKLDSYDNNDLDDILGLKEKKKDTESWGMSGTWSPAGSAGPIPTSFQSQAGSSWSPKHTKVVTKLPVNVGNNRKQALDDILGLPKKGN